MSQKVRMDMLPRLRQRYAGRGRQGKSLMIDELCEQFGYSRKHAIKLLNALLKIWLPHYEDEDGKLDASIGKQVRQISPAQIDRLLAPSKAKGGGRGCCGGSLAGDFVWSVTYTDIHSGWTANRAVWNKGAHGIVTATQDVEDRLPFAILGFDCDNGSEFPNHHLVNYFTDRKKKVGFTRSRPYQKNDNGHVEQKNWTHVRQLLGYQRLEGP